MRPSLFWFLLLDGGIVALTKLAVSKTSYDKVNDMTSDALPPRETLQLMLIGTAAIHVTEALVAGRMAKRRGLSPRGWRLFQELPQRRRSPISPRSWSPISHSTLLAAAKTAKMLGAMRNTSPSLGTISTHSAFPWCPAGPSPSRTATPPRRL